MTTLINASTTAGLIQTADTTGNLSLQSNGTTILALTSAGAAVTGTLSASGAATLSSTLAVTGAATLSSTLSSTSFTPTSATIPAAGVYLAAANTVAISSNSVHLVDFGVNGTISMYPGSGNGGSWQWMLGDQAANDMSFKVWTGAAYARRLNITSAGIMQMDGYGAGTATFNAASVLSSVSDETWKIKDGAPINPVAMVMALNPGYYYWADERKEHLGVQRELGHYAQNVHDAIGEEAAPTPGEGKPWGYYDRSVVAVHTLAIKELIAKNEALEARLAALETK